MRFCILILCIFLTFINITFSWGQTPIKGNVYEGVIISATNDEKLENVICEALDAEKKLTNYTFSDEKGFFKLNIYDNTQFLQFRLLGYNTLIIPTKNAHISKTIQLSESLVNLREVIVTVPPIQSNDDTLKYNVNSFRGQEDRYVSDVLRKLPGVKVADNGTISYMGESINKFYIEGRDLLGGQYNIATNNLDVDAISTIEVLQNNQHIKTLKGINFSEKSAIYIKLKKGYKTRPFGEAQIGVGGTPLLYGGKAFESYLGSNLQTIVNIKGQNYGEFVLNELDDKLDLNDLFSFEALNPPPINLPSPRNIPLPTKRHLFNKTYLGSANTLIPFTQNSELKINLAYGADDADQDFNLLQELAIGGEFLRISEQSKQKNKTNNARASISYENNSLDKYVKNEIVYYYKRTFTNSAMKTDEKTELEKNSISGANNLHYIQNNFQSLFKYKNDRILNLNSFLRFENIKDNLEKNSASETEINELFKIQRFVNKNRIGSSFYLFNNRLDLGIYSIFKQKKFTNRLLSQTIHTDLGIVPFQELQVQRLQIGLNPSYQIQTSNRNLFFKLELPIEYSKYTVKKDTQNDQKIIFYPSFSNTYKINHLWETYAKVGYNLDYLNDISALNTPYYTGYRAILIPSNTFNSNKNIYISGRIRYKDIVNMFFFNMNILYRLSKYNYVNVFYNTNEWSYYSTQKQTDKGELFSIMSDISKTFAPYKLYVTIAPSYTRLKSNIIQQKIQVRNISNVVSISLNMELKVINKLSLNYKSKGRIIWNENNMTEKIPLKDLTQNISLFFFPNKKIDLSITSDYVIYERKKDKFSNFFFLDFKGTYKHKRMEYGFIANNLLNNNLFSLTELSSVNIYSQQIPLRKREFLIFANFKF